MYLPSNVKVIDMKGEDIKLIVVAVIAVLALIFSGISFVTQNGHETLKSINNPPTAQINVVDSSVEEMETIYFNGSESTDIDGIIIEYTWDFDDGTKDSGMYTNHKYSLADTYTVTLTVIDNEGESDEDSIEITVTEWSGGPPNDPPVAVIDDSTTTVEAGSYIVFNGSGSTDSDGTIMEYTWEFDDGVMDSGMYSSHIYSSEGTYAVTLTVIDDEGASDEDSIIITVTEGAGPPTNEPPNAVINVNNTTVEAGSYISFNGSGSTDSDGAIVEYTWDFDDEIKDSGMYSSHIYSSTGTYNVTLTVIDDDGATNITNITITVIPDDSQTTPTGALNFHESAHTPGKYIGGFVSLSSTVPLEDTIMTIIDDSLGQGAAQDPINSGTLLQVPGGMNCTYTDANSNGEIDAGDVIVLMGTTFGDQIRFTYKPTGDLIATYMFT